MHTLLIYNCVFSLSPDIDECLESSPCGSPHNCTNTPGSYTCDCAAGYRRDDTGNCTGKVRSQLNKITLLCGQSRTSTVFNMDVAM